MATGSPGTNGVWQYGEDDSEATFSALLNKAASTTDTQIGADRARLTILESQAPGTAGQPFRMAAGIATVPPSTYVTVTFPSGRFTVAPRITAVGGGAGAVGPYGVITGSITSSSAVIQGVNGQPVNWIAVQMTASNASG